MPRPIWFLLIACGIAAGLAVKTLGGPYGRGADIAFLVLLVSSAIGIGLAVGYGIRNLKTPVPQPLRLLKLWMDKKEAELKEPPER